VKAAAPEALLPQTTAKGKKPGKSGRAAGLEAAPAKGKFLKLVNAMSDMKGDKAAVAADHPLKKGLTLGVAVKAAQPLLVQQALQKDAKLPALQLQAEKEEQIDFRRKAAKVHAAALAAAVPTGAPAEMLKLAEKGTAASVKAASADARAVASAQHAPARKADPIVHVIDLRKKHQAALTEDTANQQKPVTQAAAEKELTSSFVQKLGAAQDERPEALPRAAGSPTTQQQTPMERLKEMAGSELVKATNLIVRDGGGEIKLVLKPDSLGSVRIRMNVVDKVIEGRIIVDTPAVKQVFEGNLDALKTALTAQGFQTGALSVSVGQQNADNTRQQPQQTAEVRRIAATSFERSVPGVENLSMGELLVNLFI
jgi:flagellar hook-length control protein FliK